jgi:hypothetical protein
VVKMSLTFKLTCYSFVLITVQASPPAVFGPKLNRNCIYAHFAVRLCRSFPALPAVPEPKVGISARPARTIQSAGTSHASPLLSLRGTAGSKLGVQVTLKIPAPIEASPSCVCVCVYTCYLLSAPELVRIQISGLSRSLLSA